MPEQRLKLYPTKLSPEVQMVLWWLGIGIFCGFVFGFVIGVIVS